MQKNGTNNSYSKDDLEKYANAWSDMMEHIWRDRLARYRFSKQSTGRLFSSIKAKNPMVDGPEMTFTFGFTHYGIYVDAGSGRGYTKGNGGDLEFLGKEYRIKHKLGKPRQKRPWFNRSWFISQRVLANKVAAIIGQRYVAMFDNLER